MIARLEGRLVTCRPERVVLDVSGVGYEVQVPLSTYYEIAKNRSRCVLIVHTHVREDALQLFGFATEDERETFLHLLAISGVGPRLALAILSGIGVEELRLCVLQQDKARLTRIPGVGKKTAERLLLELRDKAQWKQPVGDETQSVTDLDVEDADLPPGVRNIQDAHSALLNLGYNAENARKALAKAAKELGDESSLEALLRGALKQLVRG